MKEQRDSIKKFGNYMISWLKRHPSMLIWIGIAFAGLYMEWIIVGLSVSPLMFFSMEAVSDVLTTSAEVVAGLYGLTLTGYIFFLDRLQQKAENDEYLEDIIALLKKRYHNMVLILSVICFVVIASSFSFVIYDAGCGMIPEEVYRFWGFETILLVLGALLFNIYFVITVVDPDKLSRASLRYKQKLSDSDTEFGSLQEFLQDYEDIEQLLMEKGKGLAVSHLGTNPWKAIKHLNGKERIEIRKIVSDPLLKNLTKLSQYYSYMVFSQEMTVTKEMCELAKTVKAELENTLKTVNEDLG